MKQKFVVIIYSHGEKPITPVDLALCLKHLRLNTSKATFQVRELR
jgi:hypothetical protein